jgi:hypothetical protein
LAEKLASYHTAHWLNHSRERVPSKFNFSIVEEEILGADSNDTTSMADAEVM